MQQPEPKAEPYIKDIDVPVRGVALEPELVGEQVLYSSPTGTFRRVKRWYKGMHPKLNGVYSYGITGWETVIEVDLIRATGQFTVEET